MSEPLCLSCLFTRGKKAHTKDFDHPYHCKDCKHNIEEKPCVDGCGKTMCMCSYFGYWHESRPNKCIGFRKKEPEPKYDRYICDEEKDVFSALGGDIEALKRIQEPRENEPNCVSLDCVFTPDKECPCEEYNIE